MGKLTEMFDTMDAERAETIRTRTETLIRLINEKLNEKKFEVVNRAARSVTILIQLSVEFFSTIDTEAVDKIHDRTVSTITAETEEWRKYEFKLRYPETVVTLSTLK